MTENEIEVLIQPGGIGEYVRSMVSPTGPRLLDLIAEAVERDSHEPPGVVEGQLCPCGEHPREKSGIVVGPFWDGDIPQSVLVCPNGRSSTEGYLHVLPGEKADRMNFRVVYASEVE